MNKHTRMSLRSGQARANERVRDNRIRPIIAFAGEAPTIRQCQYIAGEDHYMCGAEALPGKPYCATHAAICYRTPEDNDAA